MIQTKLISKIMIFTLCFGYLGLSYFLVEPDTPENKNKTVLVTEKESIKPEITEEAPDDLKPYGGVHHDLGRLTEFPTTQQTSWVALLAIPMDITLDILFVYYWPDFLLPLLVALLAGWCLYDTCRLFEEWSCRHWYIS